MKSNFYSRSYLTNFRNYFKGRVIFVTLSPAKLQMRPRIYKKTNNNWRQKSQIELTLHLNKTRNKWHGYSEPQHQTLEQINNTHCQWGLKNALFSTEELTFRIIHVTCAPPRSHQYSHGYYEAFWGWWHVIMCKELKIYNHQKIGLNIQILLALSQVHHVHQETLKKNKSGSINTGTTQPGTNRTHTISLPTSQLHASVHVHPYNTYNPICKLCH